MKERIGAFQLSFVGLILEFALKAQELAGLPEGEDITLLVFELNGIILAANASFVMSNDPAMLEWLAEPSGAGSASMPNTPPPPTSTNNSSWSERARPRQGSNLRPAA